MVHNDINIPYMDPIGMRAVSEGKDFVFFCTLKENIIQVELHVKQSALCSSLKESAEFVSASCKLFNSGVVIKLCVSEQFLCPKWIQVGKVLDLGKSKPLANSCRHSIGFLSLFRNHGEIYQTK